MQSSLKTGLMAAVLAITLPALAFGQSATVAPDEFVQDVLEADLPAIAAALDDDPALLESADGAGTPVVFGALDSPDSAGVLKLFLDRGLSPFFESKKTEATLMSQIVWYGDVEAGTILARAMSENPSRKWSSVQEALELMDDFSAMSSASLNAIVITAVNQGADEEYMLRRMAIFVVGRSRYAELREAISADLRYPVVTFLSGAGGAGLVFFPFYSSDDVGDDSTISDAATFGLSASVLFPADERMFSGFGDDPEPVPECSVGPYASLRYCTGEDGMYTLSATGGLEVDFVHLLYFRLGFGYLDSSEKTRSFTDVDPYTWTTETFTVPLPGPALDLGCGLRFCFGSFVLSLEAPVTLRVGNAPVDETEYQIMKNAEMHQSFGTFGITLGAGYSF